MTAFPGSPQQSVATMASPSRLRSPRGSPRNGGASTTNSSLTSMAKFVRVAMMALVALAMIAQVCFRPTYQKASPDAVSKSSYHKAGAHDAPHNIGESKSQTTPQSSPTIVELVSGSEQKPDYDVSEPKTATASITSEEEEIKANNRSSSSHKKGSISDGAVKDSSTVVKDSTRKSRRSNCRSSSDKKGSVSSGAGKHSSTVTRDGYDPSHFPVLDPSTYKPSQSNPVTVHLLVDISKFIQPQSKFIFAGLLRSQYIKMASVIYSRWGELQTISLDSGTKRKSKGPSVLIVDWWNLKRDCHVLEKVYQQHEQDAFQHILLLDYSGSTSQSTCSDSTVLPADRVRLAKRNIVANRIFNHSSKWIDLGNIPENRGAKEAGGPTLALPFVVRDILVDAIHNSTKSSSPLNATRSVDLAYFWDRGDYAHYGFFRREIAALVHTRLGKKAGTKKVSTQIGETKILMDFEKTGNIQESYVHHLLSARAVIVAQRDLAEDHYRLMDSLASGALVMTDAMLSLPAGLQNATNILVYDSATSLKNLIRYYINPRHEQERLDIAKRGWELAMGRHRSWHRIEHILFGKPMTHVDKPYASPPPRSNFDGALLGLI